MKHITQLYQIKHADILVVVISVCPPVSELMSCLDQVCLLADTFHLSFIMQHNRAERDSIRQASQVAGGCQ